MAQQIVPAAQLVPKFQGIRRCNNYVVLQKNPFVAPVNIEIIKSFMNRVGYQGVVDKTKINILQLFPVVVNRTNVDYVALLWDADSRCILTEEIYATDDFKEYEKMFVNVAIPMNHTQPVVSTQGMHRATPRAHRTPTLTTAKKVDEKKDDEMGSLEDRTEKMQTPIPTTRSPKKTLSSDKNIDQELTDIVLILTATTSKDPHSKRRIFGKMKSNFQDQANDPALWDVLKCKFKKSSSAKTSCGNYDFHSHGHDDHQEDNVPLEGEKRVKRHKASKGSSLKDKKRVMYMMEIVKFCDATLEKILKEVKLKIFQLEAWNKSALLVLERRYHFRDIDWFDLVHCDMFSMNILEEMFEDLGYIDGRLLFTHFKIPGQSLDEGLLPLMSNEDVIRLLVYVPRFRKLEVYIEIGVSLVQRNMIEGMTSKGKGVVIEEIMDHDVSDAVGKEFDSERSFIVKAEIGIEEHLYDNFDRVMYENNGTSISGKVWDLKTCLGDEKVKQENDVEWQHDPYHLAHEIEETIDLFNELDQVIIAEDVTDLLCFMIKQLKMKGVWFQLRWLMKKWWQKRQYRLLIGIKLNMYLIQLMMGMGFLMNCMLQWLHKKDLI
nr:transposase, MuDR [Tanacetum cinerariifolium]